MIIIKIKIIIIIIIIIKRRQNETIYHMYLNIEPITTN